MNAQEQQNYFNELAEKMMKGEITTEQACSLFKEWTNAGYADEIEALENDLSNAEKELAELKKENERLNATRMGVYQREKRLEDAEAKVKEYQEKFQSLWEDNVVIPKYWYVDEETEEKVFDTDEMESAFHDAMVDLGAYNDELECEE
jgi:uncharacterized protein YPO0396